MIKFNSYGIQQPKQTEEKVRTQIWGLTVPHCGRECQKIENVHEDLQI